MNKTVKHLIYLTILCVSLYSCGKDDAVYENKNNNKKIKQLFSSFEQETQKLVEYAKSEVDDKKQRENDNQKTALKTIRSQINNTRIAYKKIEFLAEYYYPEHVKAYINGAPLKHLDPYPYQELELPDGFYQDPTYVKIPPLDYQEANGLEKPERLVIEPQGLQVLDELIYADENIEDPEKLLELSEQLHYRSKIMVQAINKRRYIEDYQILEAVRIQLVRTFSLGVTGFDTPGSLNALTESSVVFSVMKQELGRIITRSNTQIKNTYTPQLNIFFDLAQKKLHENNFSDFDRLSFLTEVINPLYACLAELHEALALKHSSDLNPTLQAWNDKSKNLFAEDFLTPYFYTNLKAENDSDALRELGSVLFYDTHLSGNGHLSCGTCHQADKAFTDGLKKSMGNNPHSPVDRNAPTLVNAVYSARYFYDLRAFSLEDQITKVILNTFEFDTDYVTISEKLNAADEYHSLFDRAFGPERSKINRHQIVAALASYVISLRSMQSPFDQYVRGEQTALSPQAKHGFNLFMGKAACGTCHFAPTFSGLVPPLFIENESEVLGVLEKPGSYNIDKDTGRQNNGIFLENQDIYLHSFKTTTVRNIELTSPYFHNGAYATLDEVIDFYNDGGAQGLGLEYEVPNQTLAGDPLDLSDQEKSAIKAFLLTLTDKKAVRRFMQDESYKVLTTQKMAQSKSIPTH